MQARYTLVLLPMAAMAQNATPTGIPDLNTLLSPPILILLIALVYFFMIRPQMQENQAHAALLAQLAVGKDIQLTCGIIGTIIAITDTYVRLQIDKQHSLLVDKMAIDKLLPDHTVADQMK